MRDAEFAGDLAGDVKDAAGGRAQAVIGHAASERVGGLDYVEAVHRGRVGGLFIGFSFGFAAIEEGGDRTLRVGAGEVAIERHDAVGFGEIGGDFHAIAESFGGLAGERFVLVEFCGGKLFREGALEAVAGWRIVSAAKEGDFGGRIGGESGENRFEICAFGGFAGFQKLARTVWRVEVED